MKNKILRGCLAIAVIMTGLIALVIIVSLLSRNIPNLPTTKKDSIKIRTSTKYHEDGHGSRACTKEFLNELTDFYDEAKSLSKSNDLKELEKADHLLTVVIFSIPERPLIIPEEELLKRARKLLFAVNDKRYEIMNSKK